MYPTKKTFTTRRTHQETQPQHHPNKETNVQKHLQQTMELEKHGAQFATRNANHRALKQCHVLHFPDQWAQAPNGVSTRLNQKKQS